MTDRRIEVRPVAGYNTTAKTQRWCVVSVDDLGNAYEAVSEKGRPRRFSLKSSAERLASEMREKRA